MFQPRSKEFLDPRITAIVNHMRAIQNELGEIGKSAGRRGSANAAAAGNQIADALSPLLNDIADRFRQGQRAAVDQAASAGNKAVEIGAKAGSDALAGVVKQTNERPFAVLAVAIGIGVLIGAATRWT